MHPSWTIFRPTYQLTSLRVSRSDWAHWTGGSCRWERTQLACSGGDRVRDEDGCHVVFVPIRLALDGRVLLHLPRRGVVRCVVRDVTVAGSNPPRLSRSPLKNIRTRLSKQRSNSVEARCSKDMTLNAGPMSQKKTFVAMKSHCLRIVVFAVITYDVSAVRWSKCNGIICWSNFSHSKA